MKNKSLAHSVVTFVYSTSKDSVYNSVYWFISTCVADSVDRIIWVTVYMPVLDFIDVALNACLRQHLQKNER